MSPFDLASVGIVLVAALAGAASGVLPQLGRLASIAAGWAGARWGGPALASALHGRVPRFAEHAVAAVLAFVGCAVAVRIALWVALGATGIRRAAAGSGADRALGALTGAAQAGAVVWVIASALGAWNRPISVGALHLDPARSEVVAVAREHGALGRWAGDARAPPNASPSSDPRRPPR